MWTFLIVVLGVVVGLYLAVRLLWWWIRWKIGKLFDGIGEGLVGMLESEPPRITLKPRDDRRPDDPAEWDRWIEGLRSAGFTSAGTFVAEELDALLIHGLAHPAQRALAAVYWKPGKGTWCDVVSLTDDGTLITHTTLPPTGLDRPDFAPLERVTAADAASLAAAHFEGRRERAGRAGGAGGAGGGGLVPMTPQAFKGELERQYARIMDWRMARGVTEEELRRVMHIEGKQLKDDEVKMALTVIRAKYAGQLDALLREQFLEESRMSAAEWNKLEDRIILVRENSDAADLLSELTDRLGWYEGEEDGPEDAARAQAAAMLAAIPVRQAFKKVIAAANGDRAFRPLGTVHGAVTADVYVAPEYPNDDEDRE